MLHKHKSRLDFPKPDIQAVKRGFLPSMSAVSPKLLVLRYAKMSARTNVFIRKFGEIS